MSDLGPNERHLLTSLRESDEPSVEDRARVKSRVLLKLAVGGALAAAASQAPNAAAGTAGTAQAAGAAGAAAAGSASGILPAATGVAAGTGLAGTLKIAAVVAIAVASAGAGAWLVAKDSKPPPAQEAAHVVPIPATPASPRSRAPTEASGAAGATEHSAPVRDESMARPKTTAPTPSGRKARRTPAAAPARDDLERELSLLEEAQRALEQGNPNAAVDALRQHASDHPGGALETERKGALAIALCRSERTAEGRPLAKKFLVQNPNSPLAARVRAACFAKR